MSSQLRFGLLSENAYFNRVDQMLLENLRETLELQEEASRCAEASRRPDRDGALSSSFERDFAGSIGD